MALVTIPQELLRSSVFVWLSSGSGHSLHDLMISPMSPVVIRSTACFCSLRTDAVSVCVLDARHRGGEKGLCSKLTHQEASPYHKTELEVAPGL